MAEELIVAQGGKEEKYEVLYRQIEALMEGESDMSANMANVAAMIHSTFHFWWTGFYRRHIRHICDHITLALHQSLYLTIEHLIFLLLATLGNNQLLCQCTIFSHLHPHAPPESSLLCNEYNFQYQPSAFDTTDKRYNSHYQAIRHA